MKRATVPALVVGLFFASSAVAAIETPLSFRAGQWEASAGVDYFGTSANFTSGGTQSLPGGGEYRLVDLDFDLRYVPARTWAFFGQTTLGYAESKGIDATRTNSSLTGILGGAQLNFETGVVQWIPEFSMLFPIEKVSADQDSVMNSEGVSETRLRLRAQSVRGGFTLFGLLGYDIRGSGRSHLMPWSAGLEFRPSTFRLGGRLFGYQSMSTDADDGPNETARAVTSLRTNAGSLKFYGVNPSLIDSEAYAIFNWGRVDLGVFGGISISGANAASGYHFGASLTMRYSPTPVRRPRVGRPALSVDPISDEEFKEDVDDGIDQRLFRAPPPSKPKPPSDTVDPFLEQELSSEPSEDPFLPQDAPPKRATRTGQKIKNQLDEAEMTIQLKVDKKRKRRK